LKKNSWRSLISGIKQLFLMSNGHENFRPALAVEKKVGARNQEKTSEDEAGFWNHFQFSVF
jgi:hypothetical protein